MPGCQHARYRPKKIHVHAFKENPTLNYASHILFIQYLKKIRFDGILSDMLARLAFIISPP